MSAITNQRPFRPKVLTKLVAATATPEALGDASVRMAGFTLFAETAVGTPTTSDVTIQVADASGTFTDAVLIPKGSWWNWPQITFEAGYYTAAQFRVKVGTNNDGVRCVYTELIA